MAAFDDASHLVAQRQCAGLDEEVAVLLLLSEGRDGQTAVDDGKGGAVFKQLFVAILDADHFRGEYRKACLAAIDYCVGVCYWVDDILSRYR